MMAWSRVAKMLKGSRIAKILNPPAGVPSAPSVPDPPARLPKPDSPLQEVRLVRLQPGDVVVIRYKQALSDRAVDYLRDALRGVFPDNKVAILEEGAEIDIVSLEDIDT